ncbi:stromal cell-derived factor 2-like protein isoform X1 [Arachis duranensis]|uniref:Stromal cell-derived factor 2-like protein isoform X1 n=1 Tax=Arachis duranensis TaxID=130453 RepID=A0A6P4CZM4_ARADU|nr:stromal cell-derived factor 2-like protein isoform X1 [Arachis duranensis]XP_025693963.1 stromal cell-derived factor 2-like protein isoform X1 [Arachis hypogaea]XP_052115995.1 stromal cell-derived factor 2-like protein isoform X1 [Arachis duranensis]XP_052115996.1 stromal cell-derived factor 2-like protein isoform X1 [Arachis duranensis]XP_052115997.1 stromal cell-derived factor 2-like protein isoform X1 [Arachis duranensis]QHO37382.1 Stromal cell-derived factor 2-like protein [Arachis hypo
MVLLDSFHLLEICSAEIGGISSQISEFVAFEQLYGNCLDKIVRPEKGSSAKQGDTIKSETIIRLQHLGTRKWLHSHMHASPISNNLEVSCYGDDSESDKGDNWKLLIEGSGKNWKQDQKIRLQHLKTRGYLHSHDKTYSSRIVGGHHEEKRKKRKKRSRRTTAAEGGWRRDSSSAAHE